MSDRLDPIEWNEDVPLEAQLRRRQTAQRDHVAVLVGADTHDPPARTADQYEIARPAGPAVVASR